MRTLPQTLLIAIFSVAFSVRSHAAAPPQPVAPVVPLQGTVGDGRGGGDGNGPGTPCDVDGRVAIDAKAAQLRSFGIDLGAVERLGTTPDGVGKFGQYANGNFIYWSPSTCARLVHGAIFDKWNGMQRERSLLGYPTSDEMDMYDGRGRYSRFQGGFIVWTASTGAWEVHGLIGQKWWELVERGRIGGFFPDYPTTDEEGTPGVLRWNQFETASIYWCPPTGAHELHGAIRDKWSSLGGASGSLGCPASDEKLWPDSSTPYALFANGMIIYVAAHNAFEAHGAPASSPYFFYAAQDFQSKQSVAGRPVSLGRPVSDDFGFGPFVPRPFRGLTNFQLYLEGDHLVSDSIERHTDGSIYLAYTPRTGPYWYDTFFPNDNPERGDPISFGHFGRPQLGLSQPQDACYAYSTPVPNYYLTHDYSVKATPQGGASAAPASLLGALSPNGFPRATLPFTGDRGAYCHHTSVSVVKDVSEFLVPCWPLGASRGVPPEWTTILPLNPDNQLDTSLGTKTYQGQPLTGKHLKQLAQTDPAAASIATMFGGRPVRADYCSGTIGWMSSDLEGLVTNSFLSGEDYSGSHVGYPSQFPFAPNYDDLQGNPNYWIGSNMPRWFGSCSGVLPTGAKDADCDDWIVMVQPDPEYQFLQLANQGPGGYQDGNYNPEHGGSLENEIEQWLLPMGFRPEPGDRIYMTGRWIVDCGHPDWHGELHPIESYVSSHIYGWTLRGGRGPLAGSRPLRRSWSTEPGQRIPALFSGDGRVTRR